jgi:hypothetical protein
MDATLPTVMPKLVNVSGSVPLCSVYPNTAAGSVVAKVTVGSKIAIQMPSSTGVQDRFDQVLLPPGSAVVAGVLPGEGQLNAVASTLSLITDQGVRYPVPTADVLTKFGYDAADIAPVPASLMRAIPQGPTLDPTAAMAPVTVAGR